MRTIDHMLRHRTDQVVQQGRVVLSNLPFPDGQRVEIVVTDANAAARKPIAEIRRLLHGGVERFDEPFETAIPSDAWEMLQ